MRWRVSGRSSYPFGGAEHDWSAIELAAWLATSLRTTLRLLGTEADAASGRRDASRLLARARRCSSSRSSASSPSRSSIPPGERRRRRGGTPTRACSSSASPTAGGSRASARLERPSPPRAGAPVLFVRGGLRPGGRRPERRRSRGSHGRSGPTTSRTGRRRSRAASRASGFRRSRERATTGQREGGLCPVGSALVATGIMGREEPAMLAPVPS